MPGEIPFFMTLNSIGQTNEELRLLMLPYLKSLFQNTKLFKKLIEKKVTPEVVTQSTKLRDRPK